MQGAMGRLGSFISQGVYTVTGPLHPFGGAVDIVVVEQQDGTFKSSPWFVRFGKFQGVLKSREKIVDISVNGVHADFHMYLDHKGEAFFLRKIDSEEQEEEEGQLLCPSSSGDDTDDNNNNLPLKSKSLNFDSEMVMGRTSSRRSRIHGLMFGRNSNKVDSMERAKVTANLLELKWSTNLSDDQSSPKNSGQQTQEVLYLADQLLHPTTEVKTQSPTTHQLRF